MRERKCDYTILRAKIKSKLGSESNLAKLLGKNLVTISRKLNNKINFNQDEIFEICDLLEEDYSNIPLLFYNYEVRKYEIEKEN